MEPETGATLFSYDGAGNLTGSASGLPDTTACNTYSSRTVSRSYDARNRLNGLGFPDGNGNQTWTYTPDGLPDTVTTYNDGNTVTNTYTYNNRRLLTREAMVPDTLQLGWGVSYDYDTLGHVTKEYRPAQVVISYAVNALGQVTQVSANSDTEGPVTLASNATYYPTGALKQFTYGNGIVHTMTQNARMLPSKSTDCTISGTCSVANRKLDLAYAYDGSGNVTAISDGTTGARQSRTMGYDQLDRLTSVASSMFGSAAYTYDAIDNLLQVNVSGGTSARNHYYCYNATSNRLDFVRSGPLCTGTADPAVVALGYDVQGNLANKNGATYAFDYGNRLRTTAGLTYRYDANGRRVRQDNAGTQLKYSYYAQDGRLVWQRDEVASKRINYAYLGGDTIAEYMRPIGITTATITYVHSDALGSPIAKTDATKAVIETSEYEPYGKLLNRANDDRPGYTGHVMDSASGLTYMQQRYYDPQIGRFLSADPVTAYSNPVGAFNRYWYASNNPYKFTDPDGRQSRDLEYIARQAGVSPATAPPKSSGDWLHKPLGFALGAVAAAPLLANPVVASTTADVVMGDALGGASLASGGAMLYRVVDNIELSSIRELGEFLPAPNGDSVKRFLDNLPDAEALAAKFTDVFGGEQTIVKATASQDAMEAASITRFSDVPGRPMDSVNIPNEKLPELKPVLED